MVLAVTLENIILNYLPYIACAVLALIFIWTLSDSPDRDRINGTVSDGDKGKNETYYY